MEETPKNIFYNVNALRNIFCDLRVAETFVWVFVLVVCTFGCQHCFGVGCEMDDSLVNVAIAICGYL